MNISLPRETRKCPSVATRCGQATWLALWFLAALVEASPAHARKAASPFAEFENLFAPPRPARRVKPAQAVIPLPQPRPEAAPPRIAQTPAAPAEPMPKPRPAEAPTQPPAQTAEPKPEAKPEPKPPSACRLALTEEIAIAPSIPDITGPGECGGTDMVRLEAVMLRDATRVPLKPAATLRCEMASAVAAWIRDDIAPLATSLGSVPAALDNFDSFDCRGRNRVAGAKVSEHGRGNALDLRGLTLKSGLNVALTDRATARETRQKVLQGLCARFNTVLGPGSDGYHEDHIHLDLAQRRSGHRICQWVIYDPLPAIAPMLPAARPDDAPKRPNLEDEEDEKPAARDGKKSGCCSPSSPGLTR